MLLVFAAIHLDATVLQLDVTVAAPCSEDSCLLALLHSIVAPMQLCAQQQN